MNAKPSKRRRNLIIIAVLLAILSFVVVKAYPAQKMPEKICFDKNCFQVEIANTDATRQKGLMNRASLDQDKGMLFVFNKEDKYEIWMKDAKIPLDVVWLDKDGKVVDIQTLALCTTDPCPKFTPRNNAQFVLEVNAGAAKKLGIKLGAEAKLAQ